ncbi:MAG: hypothetical protein QXH80_00895 [Candidatus Nanoarchaeia archaeon]
MIQKDTLREIKRKAIHSLGFLTIIPLILLEHNLAVKVFAVFAILALFLHWYYERRLVREKYLKQLLADMHIPDLHKHEILRTAKDIKRFEEEILFGFLKETKRRREHEPLLGTFYYLFSTFMEHHSQYLGFWLSRLAILPPQLPVNLAAEQSCGIIKIKVLKA